jgi:hypothetical protein
LQYDDGAVELDRIRAGANEAERLTLADQDIKAVLEDLQSVH